MQITSVMMTDWLRPNPSHITNPVIIDYKLAPEGNYSCGDSEKRKGEKLMTGEIIARTLLKTK